MGKMKFFGMRTYHRNMSDLEIQGLCGIYAHNVLQPQDFQPHMLVTPVNEADIHRMEVPKKPIVKMAKKEHVESFFETGTIQLGSYEYYNNFDHGEIGDEKEGEFILIGERDNFTVAVKIADGFDNYLLCTYQGEPDPETLEKFGYDSGFIIIDPVGFANAIQKALGAQRHEFASCVYSQHKAYRGEIQPGFSPLHIDHRTSEVVSTARHFIKPDQYAHQQEFRFTWKMPHDVREPLLLACPEAVQYCERLPA